MQIPIIKSAMTYVTSSCLNTHKWIIKFYLYTRFRVIDNNFAIVYTIQDIPRCSSEHQSNIHVFFCWCFEKAHSFTFCITTEQSVIRLVGDEYDRIDNISLPAKNLTNNVSNKATYLSNSINTTYSSPIFEVIRFASSPPAFSRSILFPQSAMHIWSFVEFSRIAFDGMFLWHAEKIVS